MINYYIRDYITHYRLVYTYLSSFTTMEDQYSALLLDLKGEYEDTCSDEDYRDDCLVENRVSELITISKWEI